MTDVYSSSPNRTVAAVYDTSAEAEDVVTALVEAGFPRSSIDITRNTETASVDRPAHEHGFWHSITSMFDSDEDDAHVYGEGVRRGGSLVTVHTSEEMADKAIDILDSYTIRLIWPTASGSGRQRDGPNQRPPELP